MTKIVNIGIEPAFAMAADSGTIGMQLVIACKRLDTAIDLLKDDHVDPACGMLKTLLADLRRITIESDSEPPATKLLHDVGGDRSNLALESTYQAEVLLNVLLEKFESPEWDLDSEPRLLGTTMCVRLKELNSTAMSALGDDTFCIEDLRYALKGRHLTTPIEQST